MSTCRTLFAATITAACIVLCAGKHAVVEADEKVRDAKFPREQFDLTAAKTAPSGRRYAAFPWNAEKLQIIKLHAYSEDHQPEIQVFNTSPDGTQFVKPCLKKSKPHERYRHEETGRWVYWCSVEFLAPADGRYAVVFTNVGDGAPGKFRPEGEIWRKTESSGGEWSGDYSPSIRGYRSRTVGDPDGPPSSRGHHTVTTEYDKDSTRGMELIGCWVKPGVAADPNWDREARPGAGDARYLARPEEVAGNVIRRVFRSGGRDVIISSQTKKAYVQVVIFKDFVADEAAFVAAGKQLLERLEQEAADRP